MASRGKRPEWLRVDVHYVVRPVGFHAVGLDDEPLELTSDPNAEVFVQGRDGDGDRWSARRLLNWLLEENNKRVQDYVPAALARSPVATAEVPIEIQSPETFRAETGDGLKAVSRVAVTLEYRHRPH